MTEIPDKDLAEYAIEEAKEWGEYNVHDTYPVGGTGVQTDLEWSLDDINTEKCHVDYSNGVIIVEDIIDAEYHEKIRSATYNPPSKAHPAEWDTHTTDFLIGIEMYLEIAPPSVYGEPV